ncbi:MAG: sensor histidine kinase [Bryobacterales bacterium]|nr:sensor histidine kinase [Bryobacterales bacterium]
MPFSLHAATPLEPRFRLIERRFLVALLAGFSLVLVTMLASGILGLRAMRHLDREASSLSDTYVRESSFIDRFAQHQAALGVLLYELAASPARAPQLAPTFAQLRLDTSRILTDALAASLHQPEADAWRHLQSTATPLFSEIETLLSLRRPSSPTLNARYRDFTAAASRLIETSYDDVAQSRNQQQILDAGLLQSARNLFLSALVLAALCAALSVAASLTAFQRLERQAATLARLSLHTLSEQEESARRFSQEIHDEFGQTLNAIESTLTVVQPADPISQQRLADSIALVKDAQSNARELSQLLRPRILDDFGLDAGLRELARGFSNRTGIEVNYQSQLRHRLPPVIETHLFRIVQEALTNIARHTLARSAEITLALLRPNVLSLTISDTGGGFPKAAPERPSSGLGLLGMHERAQAIGARLSLNSVQGQGVTVHLEVPLTEPSL